MGDKYGCKIHSLKFLHGSTMGDKVDWSDGIVSNLFDVCNEEIEAGNRLNGQFTSTGCKNFVSKFAQKSGNNQKWHILKSIPSFSPTSQKRIIMACLALHNFICESNLHDKEFDRCDTNEDYLIESVEEEEEE
jgi:hypothetical protein